MSYSPSSSSASDKTLTPRSSPAPVASYLDHSRSLSSPSEAAQGGLVKSPLPSQHNSSKLRTASSASVISSRMSSSFRSSDPRASSPLTDKSALMSGSMSVRDRQSQHGDGHFTRSSAAASTQFKSTTASTATATMTNPVMAAMSSGGAFLHPRNHNASGTCISGGAAPSLSKERPRSHRKASSSIVSVQKIEQSHEELLDQAAGFNANADWVNYKGAWMIHVVLILLGKILLDVIPGIRQDASWTLVNLGYIAISYLMFHHVTGTPFESNAGAYDQLTLWEQIDEGAQHTPTKKWLTSVPIGVFLISTHYTKYNLGLFALNFGATSFVLLPKLPSLHRQRFKVFSGAAGQVGGISGSNSPYPSRPNTPAVT